MEFRECNLNGYLVKKEDGLEDSKSLNGEKVKHVIDINERKYFIITDDAVAVLGELKGSVE